MISNTKTVAKKGLACMGGRRAVIKIEIARARTPKPAKTPKYVVENFRDGQIAQQCVNGLRGKENIPVGEEASANGKLRSFGNNRKCRVNKEKRKYLDCSPVDESHRKYRLQDGTTQRQQNRDDDLHYEGQIKPAPRNVPNPRGTYMLPSRSVTKLGPAKKIRQTTVSQSDCPGNSTAEQATGR